MTTMTAMTMMLFLFLLLHVPSLASLLSSDR